MRIEWTTPALFDLRRIDDWLTCEVSGDVAARVLATIRQRARFLADFPQSGRRIGADHRIVRVHDTPYLIRYRICVDVLTIIRVHHERQDWLGS